LRLNFVRKVFLHLHFFDVKGTICAQLKARKKLDYNKPWLNPKLSLTR